MRFYGGFRSVKLYGLIGKVTGMNQPSSTLPRRRIISPLSLMIATLGITVAVALFLGEIANGGSVSVVLAVVIAGLVFISVASAVLGLVSAVFITALTLSVLSNNSMGIGVPSALGNALFSVCCCWARR